jgi:hypothetical protein
MAEAKSKDENVELVQKELMNEQVDADKHLLGMIQKACQYVPILASPRGRLHSPPRTSLCKPGQRRRRALWTTPRS